MFVTRAHVNYSLHMQHKVRLLIVIVLLLALATPVQAATPKAGAKCTKAGSTSTAAGKKFTCVKSGTKLVWNKGVVVKNSSTSSTSISQKQKSNLLATDSRITPTSALTSLNVCKTEDITPFQLEGGIKVAGNGFPRPAFTVSGKKSAKVLVIPMAFNNLPFHDQKNQIRQGSPSDYDELKEVIPVVQDSFKKLSAQRFEVTFDVLPKSQWWNINIANPFSAVWGFSNSQALQELIEQHKKDFSFLGYDSIAFVTGRGSAGQGGAGSARAEYVKAKNSKTGYISAMVMIGTTNIAQWWVHELGHTLFALEDLYSFSEASSGVKEKAEEMGYPGKWDLMAEADRTVLFQWNKFLMGWLYESEVRCISEQRSSVHYLSNDEMSKHPKLLTINLSTGVTLAAEAKPGETRDMQDASGLLLYTINSHIEQGEGPIRAPNTLIGKGESKSLLGWKFNVLESDADGLLLEVVKTDIDKFVPPTPKPVPQPTPSTTVSRGPAINVTKGEILSTGNFKGRASWDVSGHESYRVYVTAVDDPQKVFFESRILNGSQTPVVVEITGLPCNRELKATSMFFTEKDGKGQRVVRESLDLGVLSCDSGNKKP